MEGEARCVATRKALHGYVEKMKGNAWVGQLRIDKGAMKKTLVVWGIEGIILPNYIAIIINHYKDPY